MASRMSVDEHLSRQSATPPLRVTIQAVPDDDTLVKVTPIVGKAVCDCAYSLNIAKSEITEVELSDEVCECCGVTLSVVTVEFANPLLADVFAQLSKRSAQSAASRARSSMMNAPSAPLTNFPTIPTNLGWTPVNNFGMPIVPVMAANSGWPVVDKWGNPVIVDPETNFGGNLGPAIPVFTPWFVARCQKLQQDCIIECNKVPSPSVDSFCCYHECNQDYAQCIDSNHRREPCLPPSPSR